MAGTGPSGWARGDPEGLAAIKFDGGERERSQGLGQGRSRGLGSHYIRQRKWVSGAGLGEVLMAGSPSILMARMSGGEGTGGWAKGLETTFTCRRGGPRG